MKNLEFENWMNDGNVVQVGEDTYLEQTTQWRKQFTLTALKEFYQEEYEDHFTEGTCRNGKEWSKCDCC